jgi:hypothetical protein
MSFPEQSTVLSSWKDIARYMGKGVRTVQRWERELGLPVKRPNGVVQKSAVVLSRSDLDAWLETRFSARKGSKTSPPAGVDSSRATRAALRESIKRARELRSANLMLTLQITQSLRLLSEQCDSLGSLSNRLPEPTMHLLEPGWAAEASSLKTEPEQVA